MHEKLLWNGPGYYACVQEANGLVTYKVAGLEVTKSEADRIATSRNLGTVFELTEKPVSGEWLTVVDLVERALHDELMELEATAMIEAIEAHGGQRMTLVRMPKHLYIGGLDQVQQQAQMVAVRAAGFEPRAVQLLYHFSVEVTL